MVKVTDWLSKGKLPQVFAGNILKEKKKSSPFLIMQLNVVVQRIGAKVRLIVETCVSSFRYLRLTLGMDAGKFFAAFGGTIMII